MLRALTALIALLFVPLLVIPLLIVAIAAGPVIVMLLFITGCGSYVLILAGVSLALRTLVAALIGRIRGGERSTPTTKAAD